MDPNGISIIQISIDYSLAVQPHRDIIGQKRRRTNVASSTTNRSSSITTRSTSLMTNDVNNQQISTESPSCGIETV